MRDFSGERLAGSFRPDEQPNGYFVAWLPFKDRPGAGYLGNYVLGAYGQSSEEAVELAQQAQARWNACADALVEVEKTVAGIESEIDVNSCFGRLLTILRRAVHGKES